MKIQTTTHLIAHKDRKKYIPMAKVFDPENPPNIQPYERDSVIIIKSGMLLEAIDFYYLPEDVRDTIKSTPHIEALETKDFFIVYFQGSFVCLKSEWCYVPKSVGWKFNA